MSTVATPATPLYQQGWRESLPDRSRFTQVIDAPEIPLHQLGWLGSGQQVTSIVASTGGKIASSALTTAGAAAWAIPVVGAAVAGITIFASLWAKHTLRAKQAKDENAAVDIAVANWDESLKAVNAAYNSGQIDASTAIQAVEATMTNFWAQVGPHIQPGRNACQGGAAPLVYGTKYCDGGYGAACCVGYTDLEQSIQGDDTGKFPGIIKTLQAGGGSTQIFQVYPSKYGGTTRSGYVLTWKAPPPSKTASAVSDIASALTGGAGGSGSSLIPLALVAIGAFLFLR